MPISTGSRSEGAAGFLARLPSSFVRDDDFSPVRLLSARLAGVALAELAETLALHCEVVWA